MLSTTESEYIARLFLVEEAIWLLNLCAEFGFMQPEPTVIHEDNQACIKIALNDMIQPRTKHVMIRYHFFREMIKENHVKLVYCPTEPMIPDALTNARSQEKFTIFTKALLIEDTRIDQSGSVEDGPEAARLEASKTR